MAEKIVSPGVFTRERDLSFLPAAIGQIGAAVIGPTVKGPAFEPTIIESFKEFEQVFGPKTKESYVPYTVEQYLKSAGRVTIVRILGLSGYKAKMVRLETALGEGVATRTIGAFHPTQVDDDAIFVATGSKQKETGSAFLFFLTSSAANYNAATNTAVGITGHAVRSSAAGVGAVEHGGARTGETAYSMSINPSSANFVTNVFGKTPKDRKKPLFAWIFFGTHASRSNAASTTDAVTEVTFAGGKEIDYEHIYSTNKNELEARTPWIVSQKIGGATTDLFKFHRRSHGTATNWEFKIAIDNIRAAGSVAGCGGSRGTWMEYVSLS